MRLKPVLHGFKTWRGLICCLGRFTWPLVATLVAVCYCKLVAARSILIHCCLGLGIHVSKPKPTVLLMPGPKETNAPTCFRLATTCTAGASATHACMPAILRIICYDPLDISSYRTWGCQHAHRGSEKLTDHQLYRDALPKPITQCTQQIRGRRWSSPSHSR